ncbi:Hsp70 family protein [Arthrobacter sp. TMS2-4]
MTWGVMGYGLSVDVGTSFTAAAILRTDGETAGVPQVLPLGSRAAAIPTVVFLGADGTRLVGEAAERRGAAQPDRVAREFKRRMGDDVPLLVGDASVLPQQLIAAVVSWVVGVATEREGEAPDGVTLTHPAAWGEHRTSLLRQALAEAGVGDVVLLTEPEAAALSYASREKVPAGSTLAVYDLGGGTFDATVLRKTDADTFTVLGTPQGLERLGGADFDQEIFDHVLGSSDLPPADLDPGPEILTALTRLRKECAEAKEALSSDSEATVPVMLPGAHSQVRLVRSEFEAMIEPALGDTLVTLRAALESAGVDARDLTAILLIGGSSRIPLVAQLLSEEFDRPLAIDVDPKASVALGAAFATSVLDDASGADDSTAGAGAGATGAAAAVPVTNAAGFALPAPRPTAVAAHGPVAMAPNRRLGVRIGAVAAAVALLGIATASATNAPGFPALSALSGDQRAEAAEGLAPTAEPGSGATDPAGDDDGPLEEPDDDETFLDTVEDQVGAEPDDAGKATPSGEAEKDAEPSAEATKRAAPTRKAPESAAPEKTAPQDREPTADAKTTPPRTSTPSPTTPKPSSPSPTTPKPGTTPVDPTPPAPFPTPTPSPVPPPTQAPAVPPPTTPPAPAPTTPAPAPTTPAPEPTQPPVDPAPADPPPTDPEPQPTTTFDAPAPTDPPPSEPVTPSSATAES